MGAPTPGTGPSAWRPAGERVLLIAVPVAMAAPGWAGLGARHWLLDTLVGFLVAHGLSLGGLALPVALADDWGRTILAARLLLQILTGLALRRFAGLIGLGRVAVFGAVLVELDPDFVGGTPGGLVGTSLVLLAVERCIQRSGALALAGALGTLAFLASDAVAVAGGVLSLGWGIVRIATGGAGRRVRAACRLLGGACLGLLISFPPFALHLLSSLSSLSAGSPVLDDLRPFVTRALGGFAAPAPPGAGLRVLVALVPVVALAILGVLPGPAPRRAMPLRLALAAAAVGCALDPAGGVLLRLPLALLAAVALDDAARRAPSGVAGRAAAAAAALVLALAIGFARGDDVPLAVGAVATLALLPLGARPLPAALVTTAAVLFGAIWLGNGLSL